MLKKMLIGVVVVLLSAPLTFAGGASVVNEKAAFPEGPFWQGGKLFYFEYGRHTVMTWNGKSNQTLWKQDGCGPAAVVPLPTGEMLVTCYDSGEIVKISAGGKTVAAYGKDQNGQPLIGPNDFAADA